MQHWRGYTSFILRIGLGIFFLYLGIEKLVYPRGLLTGFRIWESCAICHSVTLNLILGIVEMILAIMILIGFLTRFSAGVLAFFNIIGIFFSIPIIWRAFTLNVYFPIARFPILAALFALMVLGAGDYSIDKIFQE